MPLQPVYTGRFKRDIKRLQKRRKNLDKLKSILQDLIDQKPLAPKHRDHVLTGDWVGHRDCHIEPDWLLIYKILPEENQIIFETTGTHSDLFKK